MTNIIQKLVRNHRLQDESFLTLCNPKVRAFYEYWQSRCPSGGKMPGRQDIAPEEMVPFLSGITLVEKEANGDLRYRVVGSVGVEMRGMDPTGMLVREGYYATNEYRAMESYNLVIESGKLLYDHDEIIDHRDRNLIHEEFFLPLAQDHQTPNMVIVFAAVRYARDGRDFMGW